MIRNIIAIIRARLWCLLHHISMPITSTIGPNSLLTYVKGGFRCYGRLVARSGFKVCVDGGNIIIKGNVFFNNDVSINAKHHIEIGGGCIFGEGVKFYDHDHEIRKNSSYKNLGFKSAPIIIGDNVWIGANVVILRGSIIGDNSVIGAGSVIKKKVPKNTVIYSKPVYVMRDIH